MSKFVKGVFFVAKIIALVLFAFLLCSCETGPTRPGPAPADTTKPIIQWVLPTDSSTVSDSTLIYFKVIDPEGCRLAKAFVDGTLVYNKNTRSTAPTQAFIFHWGTQKLPDGFHQVTIYVEDYAANWADSLRYFFTLQHRESS